MNKTAITFGLALAALSANLPSQTQDLLFTTMRGEATLEPLRPALRRVEPQDIMTVRPSALAAGYTAHKHTPHDALLTLVGDHDLDAEQFESSLWHQVDAVMIRRASGPTGPDTREIYFSPARDMISALSAYPTAHMGDVIRVAPAGQLEPFLTEQRIRVAFNLGPTRVNLDAVAYDPNPSNRTPAPGPAGMIYFSLERDHFMAVNCRGVLSGETIRDGAILAVEVLGFDANGAILGQGHIVAREAEVEGWVLASNLHDNSGAPVVFHGDLDGLALDPNATASSTLRTSCGEFPHLLFTGERMTGASVLSTQFGGLIARINGVDLGSAIASSGQQTGLAAGADSLNGLEVVNRVCALVTETTRPTAGPADVVTIEVGGARPGAPVFLIASGSILGCPVGGLAAAAPFLNPCFPDLMTAPVIPALSLGPAGADGTQEFSFTVSPALVADFCIVWQAADVVPGPAGPTVRLSTPSTTTLRP